jgi:hypothetical protein
LNQLDQLPAGSRATLHRPARAPIAPTPAHAARLTKARIPAALQRAGRQRGIDDLAADILQRLQIPQSRQPGRKVMGRQVMAVRRCSMPPAPSTTLGRCVAASSNRGLPFNSGYRKTVRRLS